MYFNQNSTLGPDGRTSTDSAYYDVSIDENEARSLNIINNKEDNDKEEGWNVVVKRIQNQRAQNVLENKKKINDLVSFLIYFERF